MSGIKIMVCYHKPDVLLKDDILTPVHVGRALAKKEMRPDDPDLKWMLDNMRGDDTGENISELNRSYNELTALYWAWKNYDSLNDPDFIGLMHYRRHFVFNEGEIKVYEMPGMGSADYLDMLNYDPERLSKDLESCDFACHLGRVDGIYRHYLANHRPEDIDLALRILREMYPRYSRAAEEYMKQDVGNFCNMFIFPKKLFFEYCEYIFGILKEFGRRTDTSEKRFFISERLTGIFIYAKMKEGLKYKVYPINFAEEKTNVPIAYPINKGNLFATEVSMISALENAKKGTAFTFYLIHGDDVAEEDKAKFTKLAKAYDICEVRFIGSGLKQEYYPLEISGKLPDVKKLIYFNEKAIAMQDLSEFYRTCSVDDYQINSLPAGLPADTGGRRKTGGDIFMINCEKFRRHGIFSAALKYMEEGRRLNEILDIVCENQTGRFAGWFVTCAGEEYGLPIFSKRKNRGQYQLEATWRPVLYYGENEPWVNIQGIYSNFWWNYAAKAPLLFSFPARPDDAAQLIRAQQSELTRIEYITQGGCRDDISKDLAVSGADLLAVMTDRRQIKEASRAARRRETALNRVRKTVAQKPVSKRKTRVIPPRPGTEEYGKLSVFNKAKVYLRTYGLKPTLKRAAEKLREKAA